MKTLQEISDEYYDDLREHAAAHPVPLPSNPKMLIDLASIGVSGAKEKLEGMTAEEAAEAIKIYYRNNGVSLSVLAY